MSVRNLRRLATASTERRSMRRFSNSQNEGLVLAARRSGMWAEIIGKVGLFGS